MLILLTFSGASTFAGFRACLDSDVIFWRNGYFWSRIVFLAKARKFRVQFHLSGSLVLKVKLFSSSDEKPFKNVQYVMSWKMSSSSRCLRPGFLHAAAAASPEAAAAAHVGKKVWQAHELAQFYHVDSPPPLGPNFYRRHYVIHRETFFRARVWRNG